MDTSSIAGAALLMKSSQTQQAMSTSMIKMASERQNMLANMIAQNVAMAPQASRATDITFSTVA